MYPTEVVLPDRLKDRPQYKGFVILYTTFIGADGLPDFKVIDHIKVRECLMNNLCGICGQKLDKILAFIGGPMCVKNRVFKDGPMHKECALYSAKVCPYLSNAEAKYSKADPRHLKDGDSVIDVSDIDLNCPTRLAIYYCKSFEMIRNGPWPAWFAKASRPTRIDWDQMPKRDAQKRQTALKENESDRKSDDSS